MNEDIKRGDEALAALFRKVGYRLAEVPGVIDGTEVWDMDHRYLFAWHRNPNHLLFYIRHPALEIRSTLRQSAIFNHGAEAVRRNPGGETLVTLRSEEDALKLTKWLGPKLPL